MRLEIKNIAKVRHAAIDIDGIAVIAGANDTGKSAVSKSLWCAFNSFHDIGRQVSRQREISYREALRASSGFRYRMSFFNLRNIAHDLARGANSPVSNFQRIEAVLAEYGIQDEQAGQLEIEGVSDLEDDEINRLKQRLATLMAYSDEEVFKEVVANQLAEEFNGEISNVYTKADGSIELTIQSHTAVIEVSGGVVSKVKGGLDLETQAVFIDDSFVVDDFSNRTNFPSSNHRSALMNMLATERPRSSVVSRMALRDGMDRVAAEIATAFPGKIVREGRRTLQYLKPGSNELIDLRNISTGMKTFALLELLLENGALGYNGTLILDEPECHLHPAWQKTLAELIVLMQKEFGIHVLLNTHSPYFLFAIEVSAAKHGLAKKCRYYRAEDEGDVSVIREVTEGVEKLYQDLAEPFQELEAEMFSL